jgi:hypothetical protein
LEAVRFDDILAKILEQKMLVEELAARQAVSRKQQEGVAKKVEVPQRADLVKKAEVPKKAICCKSALKLQ